MSLTQALPERRYPLSTHLKACSADVAVRRNGFLELAAGKNFLSARVLIIREGMKMLTDNPERQKHFPWHHFIEDCYGDKYPQEVGLKQTGPGDSENKFTFHYAHGMVDEARDAGAPVGDYSAFFGALHDLDTWSLGIALAVAETFDATNRRRDGHAKYPGSMVGRLRNGTRVIRVLRYRKKDDDLPDAKMHVDRSLFTVHAWSSHPGLKMLSLDRSLYPVEETSLETVAVFPGEKFAAVTRGQFGLGTPHGVRDERRQNGTRDEDRFAIVCFVHPEPLQDDADWLLNNRDRIERFEATLAL